MRKTPSNIHWPRDEKKPAIENLVKRGKIGERKAEEEREADVRYPGAVHEHHCSRTPQADWR